MIQQLGGMGNIMGMMKEFDGLEKNGSLGDFG